MFIYFIRVERLRQTCSVRSNKSITQEMNQPEAASFKIFDVNRTKCVLITEVSPAAIEGNIIS